MGESRTELIAWLNDLLGLHYTKIEQCGTGAAYAQVFDSIYGNVPLAKINFQAKQEYEYVNNFKVLQESFKRNKIDKPIPVERLIKCKMQDNLEWLQWSKKFWDANFPGHDYDAEARRQGQTAVPPPLHGSVTVGAARGLTPRASASRPAAAPARKPATAASVSAAPARARVGGAAAGGGSVSAAEMNLLQTQMDDMKFSVDTLEKERDFYFDKLRQIEEIVQERLGTADDPNQDEAALASGLEEETLKRVQAILYTTEEGFEVPAGAQVPYDEEETF